jgi:hypothetical protein
LILNFDEVGGHNEYVRGVKLTLKKYFSLNTVRIQKLANLKDEVTT